MNSQLSVNGLTAQFANTTLQVSFSSLINVMYKNVCRTKIMMMVVEEYGAVMMGQAFDRLVSELMMHSGLNRIIRDGEQRKMQFLFPQPGAIHPAHQSDRQQAPLGSKEIKPLPMHGIIILLCQMVKF